MTQMMAVEKLTTDLYDLYNETFNSVRGIFLDRNTSLFETLATISAEEASRPVSANCASLAAQVTHVGFYVDTLYDYMTDNPPQQKVDWGEIWRTVTTVTPEAWTASIDQLRASYEKNLALMKTYTPADWENHVGDALAVLVHTAYHLGEIRQALCTIKQQS